MVRWQWSQEMSGTERVSVVMGAPGRRCGRPGGPAGSGGGWVRRGDRTRAAARATTATPARARRRTRTARGGPGEGAELQRAGDHEHAGQAHGGRGHHRVEAAEGGQGDGGHVVGERPEQVLLDGGVGLPGQGDGVGDAVRVAADQGEVAGLDGHVGAAAEGHADVGLGQGRGVVDAVADHGHHLAGPLAAADLGHLAVGQQLGRDRVHAQLAGHRPGRRLVVPGEQDRLQPEGAEPLHGRPAPRLDPVGDGQHTPGPAVPAGHDRGPAGRPHGVGRGQDPTGGRSSHAPPAARPSRPARARRPGR